VSDPPSLLPSCRWKAEAERALEEVEESSKKQESTARRLALSLAESSNLEDDMSELERRLSEMEDELRASREDCLRESSFEREEGMREVRRLGDIVTATQCTKETVETKLREAQAWAAQVLSPISSTHHLLEASNIDREGLLASLLAEMEALREGYRKGCADGAALAAGLTELEESVRGSADRVTNDVEGKASASVVTRYMKGASFLSILSNRHRNHRVVAWGWSKLMTEWKNHCISEATRRQAPPSHADRGAAELSSLEHRHYMWLKTSLNRLCEALGVTGATATGRGRREHDRLDHVTDGGQRSRKHGGEFAVSPIDVSHLVMEEASASNRLTTGSAPRGDHSFDPSDDSSLKSSRGIFPRGRKNSKQQQGPLALMGPSMGESRAGQGTQSVSRVVVSSLQLDEWTLFESRVELAIEEAGRVCEASIGVPALHYEIVALQSAADSWEGKAISLGNQLARLMGKESYSSTTDSTDGKGTVWRDCTTDRTRQQTNPNSKQDDESLRGDHGVGYGSIILDGDHSLESRERHRELRLPHDNDSGRGLRRQDLRHDETRDGLDQASSPDIGSDRRQRPGPNPNPNWRQQPGLACRDDGSLTSWDKESSSSDRLNPNPNRSSDRVNLGMARPTSQHHLSQHHLSQHQALLPAPPPPYGDDTDSSGRVFDGGSLPGAAIGVDMGVFDPHLSYSVNGDDVVGVLRQGDSLVCAVLYNTSTADGEEKEERDHTMQEGTAHGGQLSSRSPPLTVQHSSFPISPVSFPDRVSDDVSHLRDDVAAMQARLNNVFF
jgi:hypothetical protein